ncbi:MAG: malonyl-ACP O-methyltransferase BioC [Candidatus Thiothrix moscowensis]|nr:malonyl-ACP O-methyltransferase BioC [Candidatus Thiothrix moscowensis]
MPVETANPYLLDKRKTRLGFERAADTYDANAVLQREVGERLCERLDFIRMQPQTVLDLGCGTGFVTEHLLKRYKKARVIGVDLACNMVHKTCRRGGWFRKPQGVCADVMHLPFQSQIADMLVSSLMLQWCNDLPAAFRECVQVLKPDGLLMFATFGPDTLRELRASWGQVDGYTHASRFVDMHDVGDALLQAGFRDPVVDMEMITLTYADVRDLLRDLKGIGANNATVGRNHGLTGKARLQGFLQAYEQFRLTDGQFPATYEVVYGHAWAPHLLPGKLPEKFIPIATHRNLV